MPKRTLAPIKSDVLRWARETSGFFLEGAADKVGVKPERLAEWEAGAALPTVPQLRKAGDVYRLGMQEKATQTVLEQAEALSQEWAVA